MGKGREKEAKEMPKKRYVFPMTLIDGKLQVKLTEEIGKKFGKYWRLLCDRYPTKKNEMKASYMPTTRTWELDQVYMLLAMDVIGVILEELKIPITTYATTSSLEATLDTEKSSKKRRREIEDG
jgi:hypothetical protein